MADFPISLDSKPVAVAAWKNAVLAGARVATNMWTVGAGAGVSALQVFFKMRGMDAAVAGLHDTWVTAAPDYTGAEYHGALATPLRDVVVIDQW